MKMRSATVVGSLMLLSVAGSTLGCGSNSPATSGSGGVTSMGGTTVATASGGATTPVTTGAGGATTPATTGAGGAAGATGTNPYQPACGTLTTVAGLVPSKGVLCPDAADPQLCYKTCGPNSIGFKSETCTVGSYVEQSGCSFQTGADFSCYKIPATVDPSCPTTAPQASQPCTVATCTLCGGTTGYLDSTGASKTGYCVCPTPSATTGISKWSCASSTAWPCPAGQGC
jgi:hypothetical protein